MKEFRLFMEFDRSRAMKTKVLLVSEAPLDLLVPLDLRYVIHLYCGSGTLALSLYSILSHCYKLT